MAQSKGITKITMSRETYLKYIDIEQKYRELQKEIALKKKIGAWLSDRKNKECDLLDFLLDNCGIKEFYSFEEEDEEDDMVHCVGCGESVCKFTEEPQYKDDRDEAVCEECYIELHEEEGK